MRIAPLQRQQLDFLSDRLCKLETIVDRSDRQGFRALGQRVDDWAARVAIIGQVKAGKSTFLNAFLGEHDFLPSDINPWTSVVTNMRINIPGDPDTGAEFKFFEEDDWAEMMDGTSRIREMAEELLPGFDSELMKLQSMEMREKAQRRLGAHYHAMLGTSHEYGFISGDLLKRYVCAGPGSDEGLTKEALGRYAALTKEANVFIENPEFQVPTIVTDTPGVNDPFLVRDEITCRSLDKSDVFIVVLSAHQALTDVDIGLIRILAQQDGKDVLIFVNRIDELEGYDTKIARVLEDVSERLKAAIPAVEFTILAGSAFMANAATSETENSEAEREELDTDTLAKYLDERYGQVPETRRERLLLGSGLQDIKRTLSMVIDNGNACRQLTGILTDMSAQISVTTASTRQERASIEGEIEKVKANDTDAVINTLEDEISNLSGMQSEVEQVIDTGKQAIDRLIKDSRDGLEADLNAKVERFIDDQQSELEHQLSNSEIETATFEIDLTDLHEMMEASVSKGFEAGRSDIDALLETCMADCASAITKHFDEDADEMTIDDLPYESFSTTLATSKKALKVELVNAKSWAFWRDKTVDKKKTFETMRVLAIAELRASMDKLLKAFGEAQSDRADAGMRRIAVTREMLTKTLNERMNRLEEDRKLLVDAAHSSSKRAEFVARLESQIEVLETRLKELEALDNSLSDAPISEAA